MGCVGAGDELRVGKTYMQRGGESPGGEPHSVPDSEVEVEGDVGLGVVFDVSCGQDILLVACWRKKSAVMQFQAPHHRNATHGAQTLVTGPQARSRSHSALFWQAAPTPRRRRRRREAARLRLSGVHDVCSHAYAHGYRIRNDFRWCHTHMPHAILLGYRTD